MAKIDVYQTSSEDMIGIFVSGDQLLEMLEALAYRYESLQTANQVCVKLRDEWLNADDSVSAKKIETAMEKNDKRITDIRYLVKYITDRL